MLFLSELDCICVCPDALTRDDKADKLYLYDIEIAFVSSCNCIKLGLYLQYSLIVFVCDAYMCRYALTGDDEVDKLYLYDIEILFVFS